MKKWRRFGKLLGLIIKDKKSKQRIFFKDSLNFLNAPLKKVLEDYNCVVQKGMFPNLIHLWMKID